MALAGSGKCIVSQAGHTVAGNLPSQVKGNLAMISQLLMLLKLLIEEVTDKMINVWAKQKLDIKYDAKITRPSMLAV